MLYKFKSKNTGDLIMLQPNGRRVLEIIGKLAPDENADAAIKGIILPNQMAAAVTALETAIAREEAEQAEAKAKALARKEPVPRFEAISLRQRATPFITMLQRCAEKENEIVWGV